MLNYIPLQEEGKYSVNPPSRSSFRRPPNNRRVRLRRIGRDPLRKYLWIPACPPKADGNDSVFMNFTEFSEITPAKVDALKSRIARLGIDLRLVEENFIRGSGHGGQKINKTSNSVQLKYPPLGLIVRCQRERQRSLNRFIALRELADRIEMKISPATSDRLKEFDRLRKRKSDKTRKQRLNNSE